MIDQELFEELARTYIRNNGERSTLAGFIGSIMDNFILIQDNFSVTFYTGCFRQVAEEEEFRDINFPEKYLQVLWEPFRYRWERRRLHLSLGPLREDLADNDFPRVVQEGLVVYINYVLAEFSAHATDVHRAVRGRQRCRRR